MYCMCKALECTKHLHIKNKSKDVFICNMKNIVTCTDKKHVTLCRDFPEGFVGHPGRDDTLMSREGWVYLCLC